MGKIGESGGFFARLLGPLLKTGLPLAKSVLLPLGLTAAASATNAAIQKQIFWIGYDNGYNPNWRNEWYYENN